MACAHKEAVRKEEKRMFGKKEEEVHGELESNPPQTYCGLSIDKSTKTARNIDYVTCQRCRWYMKIANAPENKPVRRRIPL